ncbi:MAG: hypothetical protein ABIB71_01450 [Candidatus Woesearchaeota archaeon]
MLVTEGSATVEVHEGEATRKLPVFYNKEMRLARDVAVYIALKLKPKRALDGMAASGIRAIRLKKEAGMPEVVANDVNSLTTGLIAKNAASNNVKLDIRCREFNRLLSEEKPFDYIDIDPFGSPMPYVQGACKNIAEKGIIAVTATDLGVLYGRYPKKCKRLYGVLSSRTGPYKETAARILIKSVQDIGLANDKSLIPIFTHLSKHYLRVYFKACKEDIVSKHGDFYFCPKCLSTSKKECCGRCITTGKVWLGGLWDRKLAAEFTLINHLKSESTIDAVGYYSIPRIAKKYKLLSQGKIGEIINGLCDGGFKASRTHFDGQGIRTNALVEDVVKAVSSP